MVNVCVWGGGGENTHDPVPAQHLSRYGDALRAKDTSLQQPVSRLTWVSEGAPGAALLLTAWEPDHLAAVQLNK